MKENYYLRSLETIETFGNKKPRLLMHVCCGPCSCFPLTWLCPHFEVTIYYANSNIYPSSEYQRRLEELKKWLLWFERDYGYHVELIVPPYDNETYMKDLEPLKDEPEGGARCMLCYAKRMGESYDYAEEHGFDYFTTVMTISRQKDSQKLNAVGKELEAKHSKTKYFYSDFKKNNGQLYGTQIRKKYGLYNQLYCGCIYSYEEAKKKAILKGWDPSLIHK